MAGLSHGTSNAKHFDFMGKRMLFVPFSILLIVATVYIWFARGEEKYGIDFVGGNSIIVKIEGEADMEKMSQALSAEGLPDASVQSFEVGSEDYSIRVGLIKGLESKQVKEKVEAALTKLHPGAFEILKIDSVGATIGEEMRKDALIAITLGLIAITIYVTLRFEFAFALGALISLFHDVAVAIGVYLWFGHDLNSAALAGALTIVGYSVNDTIVIFDRVREEIRKHKHFNLEKILNESINICLSRTIITTLTTLFLVTSLLVLGGGSIQDLALYLFVGMVSGVYSTIYIASPVVLWWNKIRPGKLLAGSDEAVAAAA
jgi:preprotein translocase subunit SecF